LQSTLLDGREETILMAPFKGMVLKPLETSYHPRQSHLGLAVDIEDFSLWYGDNQALFNINMQIQKGMVTAIIGPSGCGKSTLLCSLNRINDLIDGLSTRGRIIFGGANIYDRSVDVITLRKRKGMVFQKPNPFPKTIEEHVNYPLRVSGIRDKHMLRETAERALKGAGLWDEVRDRPQETETIFTRPRVKMTTDYITGRFGKTNKNERIVRMNAPVQRNADVCRPYCQVF